MRAGRRLARAVPLVLVFAAMGCVIIVSNTAGRSVPTNAPVDVTTPVRAYLLDGSIAVYPVGATIGNDTIRGAGWRFAPTLRDSVYVRPIPLDSVIGVETFERSVNEGLTLLVSAVGTAAAALGGAAVAVAVFGSCPTIYSDSMGIPVLEAESYSYAIAPLLEQRDVDRLRVRADSAGVVRLEVRNEALETHYTDENRIVEVIHDADETVLPAANGGYVAVRALAQPAAISDRAGRDLLRTLASNDDLVFATDERFLLQASAGGDALDHIDLTVARDPLRDSIAVVIRMRSSLLSTVLLYDHMLARPGARSLDWMARDLGEIAKLAELASWYQANFGLRVAVLENGAYRQVASVMNVGPAAWHDIAAVVPAAGDDSVRIRLSFPADEWRIDRVAVTPSVRAPVHRGVELARVVDSHGGIMPDARKALVAADGKRLQTLPGQRYFMEFDVGPEPDSRSRTFMLVSQGYYVEWVRGSWLKNATASTAFSPSSQTMASLFTDWRARKDSLEENFFALRVPISDEAR